MDRKYQARLITGALKDYQNGLMSLEVLIGKIEALLGVVEDKHLTDQVFESLSILEEIYAYTLEDPSYFNERGKSVVDLAVLDIIRVTTEYGKETQEE